MKSGWSSTSPLPHVAVIARGGRRGRRFIVPLLVLLAGAGCGRQVTPEAGLPEAGFPADFPYAEYRESAGRVFRIAESESEVTIRVYRDGPLARFGHDHVIHHESIGGMVAVGDTIADVRADLFLAVSAFVVDDPARRAEAGFDTEPSADDIAGTRANMLGSRLLNAANHPYLRVTVDDASGMLPAVQLAAAITVAGRTARVKLPATVDSARCALHIDADWSLQQSELGLEPFSVLGGALRVGDTIDIRLRLVARAIDDACPR